MFRLKPKAVFWRFEFELAMGPKRPSQPTQLEISYAIAMAQGLVQATRSLELQPADPAEQPQQTDGSDAQVGMDVAALLMEEDFSADFPPVDCTVPWSTRINDAFLRMSGASSGECFTMSALEEVLEACLQAGHMHSDQCRVALSEMKKGGRDHMLKMIQHLTKKERM